MTFILSKLQEANTCHKKRTFAIHFNIFQLLVVERPEIRFPAIFAS